MVIGDVTELVESALARRFPHRWGTVPPHLGAWIDNGLTMAYGDQAVQFRVGMAQGLALSEGLVRDVAMINTALSCGAIWVAEDADGSWQVLWGDRRPWRLMSESAEEISGMVIDVAQSVPTLIESVAVPIIYRHGGRSWRLEVEPASAAALLLAIST